MSYSGINSASKCLYFEGKKPLQSVVMQQFIIWQSYVFLIKQLPQIKCNYFKYILPQVKKKK